MVYRRFVRLLLLCWLVFCPFGIVLLGLPVSFPTCKLPDRGHVCELVTDGVIDGRVLGGDGICRVSLPRSAGHAGVSCESRVLGSFERIRLNRKTQHTLQDLVIWGVFRLVPGFGSLVFYLWLSRFA